MMYRLFIHINSDFEESVSLPIVTLLTQVIVRSYPRLEPFAFCLNLPLAFITTDNKIFREKLFAQLRAEAEPARPQVVISGEEFDLGR
jgi:hypothetical protein